MNCKRFEFSLPVDQIYLNGAYMSPSPNVVLKTGQEAILRKSTPAQITIDDFFKDVDMLKKSFAGLCSINDYRDVSIISSASYGLATVARNIKCPSSGKIIVVSDQFPSNVYIWQKLAVEKGLEMVIIGPPPVWVNRGKTWNENLINAIDQSTVLVAMANVHWADGTKFDLTAIREASKKVGALLIIDGTQSIGALPFNVEDIQPDALVCAGYKWLMGPYSIGLAWYGEYFRDGNPLEENWINRLNSEDFRSLVNYETRYQPGMIRYDMGEKSNFILVPMMIKAIEYVSLLGPENIQQYCAGLLNEPLSKLTDAGWWIEDHEYRSHHLFGIRPPDHLTVDKCVAHLREKNIFVSARGQFIRISPNVYNDKDDLIKLADVLTQ